MITYISILETFFNILQMYLNDFTLPAFPTPEKYFITLNFT